MSTAPSAATYRSVAAGAKATSPANAVLAGLTFTVPKARPPAGYGLLLSLLAGCLVLMPVAYAGLVGFLTFLAVWHGYEAVASFSAGPFFVFHLPMAAAAGLLVTFLVKPVFLRAKGKPIGVVTLTAAEQPVLFEAVDRLCDATGARRPSSIEVDCVPNAHARFRRFRDSVGRGEVVLRIGLPLAAGLSARQLLGVVGHELGHFNQRRGMAGAYLIRLLAAFFGRVVFQRDRIDASLARLRRRPHPLARLSYGVVIGVVEPMRGLLWLMLVGGELLTCGVLRRMEHDADDVEAHVAGGADFARTAKLLVFLDIAHRRARADLADAYAHQRLADDLPRLIVVNAKQLREHRADVLKLLDGVTTRWFDSHPCHADRIAHVRRLGATGLFAVDLPAKALFDDFAGLCRRATDDLYRGVWDAADLAKAKVVSTDELAADRADQRSAAKVLRRYFRGHVVPGRPILPDVDRVTDVAGRPHPFRTEPSGSAAGSSTGEHDRSRGGEPAAEPLGSDHSSETGLAALIAARQAAEAASAGLAATVRRYAEAATLVPAAEAQLSLCRVFWSNPKTRPLAKKAERLLDKQRPALAETTAALRRFEQPAADRLTLGLQLIRAGEVPADAGFDVAAGRAAIAPLLPVCAALAPCVPTVVALAASLPAIQMLTNSYDAKQPYQPLVRQILDRTAAAGGLLAEVRERLSAVPYPFAHGSAGVTVADHLVRVPPDAKDPVATHAAVVALLDRFHELAFRSLSVLTTWAERAEAAVGLPPLAEAEEAPSADDEPAAAVEQARRSRRYWLGYGGRAAAGLAMVAALVWLSVSPPTLPDFSGGERSDGVTYAYRPAAFHVGPTAWGPMVSTGPQTFPVPLAGYGGRAVPRVPTFTLPPGFAPTSGRPTAVEVPSLFGRPTGVRPYAPPTPYGTLPTGAVPSAFGGASPPPPPGHR